jgi:hypothetical protein
MPDHVSRTKVWYTKSWRSPKKFSQADSHIRKSICHAKKVSRCKLSDENETIPPSYSYEYRWADGAKIKRPIEVSAPKYVEYLMDWVEAQLDEETIFPQKLGR